MCLNGTSLSSEPLSNFANLSVLCLLNLFLEVSKWNNVFSYYTLTYLSLIYLILRFNNGKSQRSRWHGFGQQDIQIFLQTTMFSKNEIAIISKSKDQCRSCLKCAHHLLTTKLPSKFRWVPPSSNREIIKWPKHNSSYNIHGIFKNNTSSK